MAKNPTDNIDKAIEALQMGLDIADGEETIIDVPEKTVEFESDVEIKNLNSIVENQIQTFLPQITLNKVTSQFLEDEHQLIIKIIYQYNLDGALDAVQLNFNK